MAWSLPINPAEDFRVVGVRDAEGDPMRPVLGEAVLLGHGLEALRRDGQLHQDVGLVRARVVAPQRRERFVNAAFA